ncbi:MAG: response regulator [Deltaproteobacteria bacterium]|nr:response regulator [Deltaproteobacteria bacterium]
MRVLVVERSHDDRRAIVDALVPMSEIAVQGAVADLQSAIRAILDEAPEIVVTGIELPDGSGLDLIESARQAPKPPKIVVVADTPTRDEWCRHLAAGADRFVALDAEFSELRDVITDLARTAPQSCDELALVGRLAAGVTHDLNNYLGALALDLAMLKRNPSEEDLVSHAIESTDTMIRLSQALLQYVRGEQPPMQLVDLSAVVRGVIRMIQRSIPHRVKLDLDLSEKSRRIYGAPAELEQLVANLVLNSIDAMPEGGTLRIRVQPTGSDAVFLEVADEGSGAPGPTTKPGRRVGLGLGIVKRVVERHLGTLRISPRHPRGTLVTIFLPTRPAS